MKFDLERELEHKPMNGLDTCSVNLIMIMFIIVENYLVIIKSLCMHTLKGLRWYLSWFNVESLLSVLRGKYYVVDLIYNSIS